MRCIFIVAMLTLTALSLLNSATCQEVSKLDARYAIFREIAIGMRLDDHIRRMRNLHRRTDLNSDGVVSVADFEQYRARAAAAGRDHAIRELLRYDLDGDGVVTRAEVVQAETKRIRSVAQNDPNLAGYEVPILQRIDRAADFGMRADMDRDGRIDSTEMAAFAEKAPILSDFLYEQSWRSLMSFDENGDGIVTVDEVDRVAGRIFKAMDLDKDGMLSKAETDVFVGELRQATDAQSAAREVVMQARAENADRERQERRKLACALPSASPGATVLLLSEHHAEALSTATIGSQWIATETGVIDIDPGAGSLYVVVASYNPVIWQFFGAVDRVERLVLAGESTGPNQSVRGERPLIGAIGVPPERIGFLGQPGCMTALAGPSVRQSDAAAEAVRLETGRQPILIKPRKQKAADAAFSPELLRFHPGGVQEIDPRTVVASASVERYVVLPEEAGLSQLEQEGAITRTGSRGLWREFLVRKETRFPAGLNGGHLVMFRIQKGVPVPQGDPGHSCVTSEETGLALYNGASCGLIADLKRRP